MAYPSGYPYPATGFYPPPPPYTQTAYPAYPSPEPYQQRQYYFIRSRMNGLVLDIQGGSRSPGAKVIVWNQKPADNDNQLWYDDVSNGTIRSKLNDFVLDIGGDGSLVVNPFSSGNINQLWYRADAYIRNRVAAHRVLDVAGGNRNPGARVIPYDCNGGINQMFDIQYVPSAFGQAAPPPRPLFYIVSEMNCKVLDIQGGSPVSGARVIMWPKKSGRPSNQLWYFDSQGVIRSALNDFVMEAQTDGAQITMMPYSGSPHQQWTLMGNRIMKNQFESLDIAGENRNDGAKVISYRYKGSANQHWRLEYV